MKATSHVFQSIQQPTTILGLPPKLMLIALGVSALTIPVCSLLGVSWLALIAPLTVFVGFCVYLIKLRRKEPHCETIYFRPRRFFKGKKERIFRSGGPQK